MYAQNMGEHIAIEELIDLSGKRALVTGGLKGIGKSIASRLSECGATVLVADNDSNVKNESPSDQLNFIECDITGNGFYFMFAVFLCATPILRSELTRNVC